MKPAVRRAQVLQYPSGERFILKTERVTEEAVFVASDESLHATLQEWQCQELALLFKRPNKDLQEAWGLAHALLNAEVDTDKLHAILTAKAP